MKAGRLTCRGLVEQYLRRIDTFDKNGPAINAIVMTNPDALKQADAMDQRFKQGGLSGPLHCIPTIVKDNFETIGLQSANGSLALAGFVSDKDAFLVKKIKDAGAIVIAKSNMAEWAFTPNETLSSILPGYTKNPVRARSRHRGIERRHGGERRRELRRRRPRQRHRQFDPRAVIASGARRHSFDDGIDEPGGRDAAESAGGYCRADGAHG